jgi:hypothetical protein
MKSLVMASAVLLAASSAAFGTGIGSPDVSITFNQPAIAVYPPSYDQATCDANNPNGISQPCLVFSGTIMDNDTDGSPLDLTGVALSAYNSYFTVDNTFSNATPGLFEGDADGTFAPDYAPVTYTGPILGIDIAADTPTGTYNDVAEFLGDGGTVGPDMSGYFAYVDFTVVLAPEPSSGGLAVAGLLAGLMALCVRRRRRC